MFSTEIKDFKDIENDEKELEKINDMLISSQGNTSFMLSTLQDCQKKYDKHLSSLRKEYWKIEDIINNQCLSFVGAFLGVKAEFKAIRVEKTDILPEDEINANYWEWLAEPWEEEHYYYLLWSDESYNKNAKEVLGNNALEWDKVHSYLNRSFI